MTVTIERAQKANSEIIIIITNLNYYFCRISRKPRTTKQGNFVIQQALIRI